MDTLDNPKLEKLLWKLLDPAFKIKNETYLHSLLDHLKISQAHELPRIHHECFVEWIKKALAQWTTQNAPPRPNILAFALNLTILQLTEESFVKLNNENIFEKLIVLVRKSVIIPKTGLEVKLAYIRLLSSFLNHKCGIYFIISTNYWSQVVDFVLNSDTIYIRKEGCKFIAILLQKSVDINEFFCCSVIQVLSSPLLNAMPKKGISEQEIYKNISPSFFLLNQVFASLLELCGPINDVKIFKIILEKFAIEKQIRQLQSKLFDEELIFQLNKILFTLAFFDFVLRLGGRSQDIHLGEANVASQKLFDVLLDAANRGPVENFLKLLYVGVIYWHCIKPIMPSCKTPESTPIYFETQLLSLQLFPLVVVNMRFLGNMPDEAFGDILREEFMIQMTKYITPDTFRTTFKWKSYLQQNISFDHATLALKYVLQSRKFYTRETAKTAFQMIIHALHDTTRLFKKNPQNIVIFIKEYNYLCMLLETLTTIINDFTFTWQDCFESVCVTAITFDLLSYPMWPSKLIVRGLKLMEVAITKYMAPNMALLVDTSNSESVVYLMGPILYAKTHDGDWEVRDSALEFIKTYANIAKKFPSLRRTILDSDFPSITLKMSKGDMEPYVRATAYKCLQEMVEINEFWNNLLQHNNTVLKYFIEAIHQESEGIVRKEIATLISILYEFQELSDHDLSHLYDIMSHAATVDLHWEVKVKVLDFWHKVLERHLMDQGVIDGTFPKITFSKEHRKIITLTETEIRKRLVKVLDQLSQTGCLAVFIAALQDDCDVEVCKKAVDLIKNFVKMLKQFNITKEFVTSSEVDSPKSLEYPQDSTSLENINFNQKNNSSTNDSAIHNSSNSVDSPYSSEVGNDSTDHDFSSSKQDCVIDEILNAQDMKLLENMFNSAFEPVKNSVQIKTRTVLNIKDFLDILLSNFEVQVKQRTQWLQDVDSFNSLLDDILNEYKHSDVNSMDCY